MARSGVHPRDGGPDRPKRPTIQRKDAEPLTWGNLTQTTGIVFEISTKSVALEVEGILVNLP